VADYYDWRKAIDPVNLRSTLSPLPKGKPEIPYRVESNPDVRRIMLKVNVGREDRDVDTAGHGTDEQIDRCPRDAVSPADVEETRRLIVVGGEDLQVAEITKSLLESGETLLDANPREDFLADGADENCLARVYEPNPFLDQRVFRIAQALRSAPQGERPDRGVDEDDQVEPLRRRFL
jgi:hypothetical protein